MSVDSFTTVTHQSWFGRLKDSVVGVLFGLALFVGSFFLLTWNEGRSVRTARALTELKGAVVSVESDRVDEKHEGQPVHLSGTASANQTLADEAFAVSVEAIKLRRSVEMFQWREEKRQETREKVGGGTETRTTYTYDQRWSSDLIDSRQFAKEEGHANPHSWRFQRMEQIADRVVLGAFTLSSGLVGQMNEYETLPIAEQLKIPESDRDRALVADQTVYLPNEATGAKPDPAHPVVGDLRIKWQVVKPAVVSVIAGQANSTLGAWQSTQAQGFGTQIERLQYGTLSAAAMVGQLEAENTMLTWLLRGGGYLMMAFGIGVILRPIAVFASFIPIFGSLTRGGILAFSLLIAMGLSLATIAVAWLAYRPWLAAGLIAGTVVSILLAIRFLRRPAGAP
jgi:hypothetical protein